MAPGNRTRAWPETGNRKSRSKRSKSKSESETGNRKPEPRLEPGNRTRSRPATGNREASGVIQTGIRNWNLESGLKLGSSTKVRPESRNQTIGSERSTRAQTRPVLTKVRFKGMVLHGFARAPSQTEPSDRTRVWNQKLETGR